MPYTDTPLPGIDPRWSRTVDVASNASCEPVRGRVRRWHVLDNLGVLEADGKQPAGTVLAVHGNPTWSYLWRNVIAAATEADRPWRVVAVDHLDMGFSERTGLNRRFDDRIQDLTDLTAALGLDDGPVVTLAHDWGGLISMGWAEAHPSAHAGTIMTNTAVYHDPDSGPIPSPLRLALAPGVHGVLTSRTSAFLDVSVSLVESGIDDDVKAAFKAPYRSAQRRGGIENFVADIPAFDGHPSNPRYERTASWVAGSTVPALFLWGTQDPVFKERYLQDLIRRMPQATVHRYEGANHLLPQDRPVEQPIVRWLAETFADEPTHRARHQAARPRGVDDADFKPFHAGLAERAAQQTHAWEVATADMGAATNDREPAVRKRLSWTELETRVDRIASGLLGIGVRPGDRINLMVPPGTDLTTLIYACFRIGAVIVVADTGLGAKGLSRALKGAAPTWLVGIPQALAAAKALGWPGTRISTTALDPVRAKALGVTHSVPDLEKSDPIPVPELDPDADAAVLFTSGSTGPAKGVVYTQRQMAAMRDAVSEVCDLRPGTGLVAAFAPFALLAPAMGASSVTPDMDVTKPRTLTARALADAAGAISATSVFASPAAIQNVLDTQGELSEHQREALAKVRLMLSAGAPLPPPLLEDLQDLLPNATLHTPYGMTECLPLTDVDLATIREAAVDGQPADPAEGPHSAPRVEGAGRGVCVGTPVPGAVIRIRPLDHDGVPAGELVDTPGVLGEIVAQAPHMKDRYDRLWVTENESTRIPGWHCTSDVGHFDAKGRLWVEGRLGHVLLTADGVVAPVAAEHAADNVPGIGRTAVVGVGPRGAQVPVAVCELQSPSRTSGPARPALAAKVRAAVVDATGLDLAAVLVVRSHPTDVRHNSKIDRTLLAEWAANALGGGKIKNP
ncbi:alpha/beta fold hydrolase [Kocuria coralli]|uniref:Alpha/beta fold hydrolase n=1 Tax=Kocuria coralli TaxID=1461025 RepID=A0A5J5L1F7_9MICC|nr:alpha/beta fold hydrolase [Kocuria coralli]